MSARTWRRGGRPPAPPAAWRPRTVAAVTGVSFLLGLWGLGACGVATVDLAELARQTASAGAGDPVRLAALERRIAAEAPRGRWALVDSHRNRLAVFSGETLLREAVCSTGSGYILRHRASGREWVFDTPIGERRVVKKARDPVWVKPDWAFVEEGREPPANLRERYDEVSLGDYGIYLGDGYLIHGTLFRSLLGQKVTHGCIRLGDDDLEYLYRKLHVGDRVLLF